MQDQHDFSEYVLAWRERLARQESEKRQRALHMHQVARECARRLVHEFGANKVYLFGSLLEARFIHDRSDIDLAVEGLDGTLYWKALSSLWALLPEGVELDLVPLERAQPSLAERVRMEGELLDAAA
jgi:predicted nucleotidyltransferase